MSTALHLAKPSDLDRVVPLVAAFHTEFGLKLSDTHRRTALLPLLEGSPHGAVYILGPTRAPIGYIVVTFGWSVELGGLDGFVDEIYVRPGVRGRGLASEALGALCATLKSAGMKAIHLEVDRADEKAQRVYQRALFRLRDRYALMSRKL